MSVRLSVCLSVGDEEWVTPCNDIYMIRYLHDSIVTQLELSSVQFLVHSM